MGSSTPAQRSVHSIAGHTVRADCEGGALASDCGVLLLRGIARQSGRTARLAAAIHATRPPADVAHPRRALLAPRLSPMAAGSADGHAAHSRRRDPLCQLGGARPPLAPAPDLARAPTGSRLAHRVERQDLSRRPQALGAPCGARSPEPPAALVLALAPTDDPPHGQQERACDNHYSKHACSLPLLSFAGRSGALVTAGRRPGTRPTGAEQALLVGRLLAWRRRPWPQPPRLVRGDRPGATPEVRAGLAPRPLLAVVCGLAGPPVVRRPAAPVRQAARPLHPPRTARAQAPPARSPPPGCRGGRCGGVRGPARAGPPHSRREGRGRHPPRGGHLLGGPHAAADVGGQLRCAWAVCQPSPGGHVCPPQRPHLRHHLPGARSAAAPGWGRLCLASGPPHLDAPTAPARSGPPLDGPAHPLHSGRAGHTVQGPAPPPPPECLSRPSAAVPGDGCAVSRPSPRRPRVVRGPATPTSTGRCPSHGTQDAPQRWQGTAARISSAHFLVPSRPAPPRR
jgi:hypothetical protein